MDPMISYAQNGEDVILKRVFGDKKTGCYIDIGASHPENLSVTKYFYDMGWRGINVDPLKNSMELFSQSRPDELNLNVAIDIEKGFLDFYEITDYPELSTFSAEAAASLLEAGHKVICYPVERITGNELFEKYVESPVDFLKIDVEGRERDVIRSIDFHRYRPKVLVIEATIPNSIFPGWDNFESIFNFGEWEPILLNSGYILAYFDGLNRFYISEENKEMLSCFQVGLCLWDNFFIHSQVKRIADLEWNCAERMKQVEMLTGMLKESETDREARGTQVETLTRMLEESEADRQARGTQVETLTRMLEESEADREARGTQVETLTRMLEESEADRQARWTQIETLTRMLKESETDRQARGTQIETLTRMLEESEADRQARWTQIETLTRMLKEKEAE
ncbi:FkbM family methyltransferase [Methylobacter sp. Wu8]|uniref:FkbM family methyltransferase n=1 Tax=Methylobacter tundripaludum TaxID=173365 RepID=A0A2S6H296_9GAMM|nr:FkbM family methyltransferase [Methylobacter tundripaludum]PPK71550.1 FkbM family methyltransferase [Methylobacter tundripaludum]